MFTKIKDNIEKLLEPVKSVPVGSYQFQGKISGQLPYRLNLRVESNGTGILILNASTVLHLNRSATEYAYYMIQQTPIEQAAQEVSEKYAISADEMKHDFADFCAQLDTIIHTPDLDPVTYLDLERVEPYSRKLSAPYRLDCALTYQVSENASPDSAPTYRVKRELTTQEWCTILEKVQQVGIPQVVFTGGEPTLRSDLPALISKCEELGIVSGLLTDGLRFIEKSYMKTILNSGLDHIMLLGAPAEDRFWKSLKNLMDDDIAVTVHLTLTSENLEELLQSLPKLAAAGLHSLSLSASEPAMDKKLRKLQDQAISQGLSLIWDLPVPYSQFNPITAELKSGGKRMAKGAGNAWLYVEPDGDVLPAQGINRVMGNLLTDPWSSIWKKR
ncbi:MAG: radical SAM/SPASM domain-containing protein [Anaerolineaceae bacterium]